MHRWLAALLVLSLLAPATAAAQDNPFGPLPQSAPSPAPTAPPDDNNGVLGDTGDTTLYIIGAGLLVAFLAIGWWIARDARRFTPREEKRLREQGPHKHARQAKAKARARTKAQRAARRRNR